MAGLVSYESSDEDAEVQVVTNQPESRPADQTQDEPSKSPPPNGLANPSSPPAQPSNPEPTFVGPMLPPQPQEPSASPSPDPDPAPAPAASAPGPSPYSTTRTLLRDLTLPPVPNLSLPPSPPGSPPPALTARVDSFLKLKAQGTHYNVKLESMPAMRNPSLSDKLLGFAGLTASDAYATSLSADVYDPKAFPAWAFRAGLREWEERQRKKREGGRVEFVKATAGNAEEGEGAMLGIGGPGGLSKKRRHE